MVDSPAAASNLPTVSRTARSDSLTSLAPVGTPRVSGAGTAFDPPPGLASSPVDPAGPSADAGPVGSTRLSSDSARPAGAVATLLAPARIQRSTLATHPLLPMTRPGHLDRSRPAARSGAAFGHTTSPAADSAVAPLVPRTVAADTTQPAHANGAAPLEVLQRAWSSARPRRSTRRRALLGPPDQPPPPPPPVSPPPDEPPALPEPDPAPAAAEPEGGARGVTDLEPTDLDLLAGKLLDPLLRRLRQELLLDRERRGLRADRR